MTAMTCVLRQRITVITKDFEPSCFFAICGYARSMRVTGHVLFDRALVPFGAKFSVVCNSVLSDFRVIKL